MSDKKKAWFFSGTGALRAAAALCLMWTVSCRTPSSREELDRRIQANSRVGLSHVFYKGTRGEHHYLRHQHGRGVDVYRIHRDALPLRPERPYSRHAEDWLLLAERWWPDRDNLPEFDLESGPAPDALPAEKGRVILRPASPKTE